MSPRNHEIHDGRMKLVLPARLVENAEPALTQLGLPVNMMLVLLMRKIARDGRIPEEVMAKDYDALMQGDRCELQLYLPRSIENAARNTIVKAGLSQSRVAAGCLQAAAEVHGVPFSLNL